MIKPFRAVLPLLFAVACGSDKGDDTGSVSVEDTVPDDVPVDADADGYAVPEDCDDADALVNPAAQERCDDVDNDCDGEVDEDATNAVTGWADADGDTYGDPEGETQTCAFGDGMVRNSLDCDDTDADVYPGAVDVPGDGVDGDCDGEDPVAFVYGDAEDLGDETGVTGGFLVGQAVELDAAFSLVVFAVLSREAGTEARMALYADESGKPGALLAQSEVVALAEGENDLGALEPVALEAGTYWLTAQFSDATNVASDGYSSSTTRAYARLAWGDDLPDPFGSTTSERNTRLNLWVIGTE